MSTNVQLNKQKLPIYISQIRRNDGRILLEKEDWQSAPTCNTITSFLSTLTL